jgi:Ran GTPase-activating protein (RanGAP) involved in mRNA processing and transport
VLSPHLLASGSDDKTIKVWNVNTGACVKTLTGHNDCVSALAILPDRCLASGSGDCKIKLWDVNTGVCITTLAGHGKRVCALAALPDWRLASGDCDGTVKLWHISGGTCVQTLEGNEGGVYTFTILPDDRLASGGRDCTIKLWNAKTGICMNTLTGHNEYVCSLVMLRDGRLASGSVDGRIMLTELYTQPLALSDIKILLQSLKTNTSVTTLYLSHPSLKLDSEYWQELAAALAVRTNISEINLSNTGLDDSAWEIIVQSLASNANLASMPHIISTGNPVSFDYTPEQLGVLITEKKLASRASNSPANVASALKLLVNNSTLTALDLSGRNLTSEHMGILCTIITTCPNLRAINLSNTPANIIPVLNLLVNNQALTTLDLTGHNLTPEHIWILRNIITTCPNLHTLKLSNTRLNYDAVRALLAAMQENRSLKSLDISDNTLPQSSIAALQAQMQQNGGQLIGDDGVIGNALPASSSSSTVATVKTAEQIPPYFLCPLSRKVMIDPVLAANGDAYERKAAEQWLATHDSLPDSQDPDGANGAPPLLEHKELCPDNTIRELIYEFVAHHPVTSSEAKLFFNHPAMTELDMSNTPLGGGASPDPSLDEFVTQLREHRGLRSLKLNRCALASANQSFDKIVELLKQLPALTHLELRATSFDEQGFQSLLGCLNPELVYLDLRECKLNPAQIERLAAVTQERGLKLTTCLLDETVANFEAVKLLKQALQLTQRGSSASTTLYPSLSGVGFFRASGSQPPAPSAPPERNPVQGLLDKCKELGIDFGDAPERFRDPITKKIMTHPVITKDGYSRDLASTSPGDRPDKDIETQRAIIDYLEAKIREHKKSTQQSSTP